MRILSSFQYQAPPRLSKPHFGIRTHGLTDDEQAYVAQGVPAPDGLVPFVLNMVGNGKAGLSVHKLRVFGLVKDTWVVYRDPDGKPVCAALLHADPASRSSKLQVSSLVADKTQGLLAGRAVMAVVGELEKMGITEDSISERMSPEARLLLVKLRKKRAKEVPARLIIARA